MKLMISKNGSGEIESSIHTGVALVEIINDYLEGKTTALNGNGNGGEMLKLLRKLEPDTTLCMGYQVLSMLRGKEVDAIFGEHSANAAIAAVLLDKYVQKGVIKDVGSTSLKQAAKAHKDFGKSPLEEVISRGVTGRGLYKAAASVRGS